VIGAVMVIILKVILGSYAILMLVAACQNFLVTYRLTNMIIGLSSLMMLGALLLSETLFRSMTITALILFQLMAFLNGYQQQFHLVHHIVRLIITMFLVIAILTLS